MPADALPQPLPEPAAGSVQYRREYRDALGRPVRGLLTISGAQRSASDQAVVVAAPVTVSFADGVLEVDLPPGDYAVKGFLTTVDGNRVPEEDGFTLG